MESLQEQQHRRTENNDTATSNTRTFAHDSNKSNSSNKHMNKCNTKHNIILNNNHQAASQRRSMIFTQQLMTGLVE